MGQTTAGKAHVEIRREADYGENAEDYGTLQRVEAPVPDTSRLAIAETGFVFIHEIVFRFDVFRRF